VCDGTSAVGESRHSRRITDWTLLRVVDRDSSTVPPLQRASRAESSDKPIYTRAQIARLYSLHRRGAYAGREAEWARQEADFYTPQREGRVLGGFDVSG
jgi:hypothetical protein